MMEYLQAVGAVAQFDQAALDIPNTDEFLYEMAIIKNIHPKMLNSRDQVAQKRQARQQALQAEKAKQEQAVAQEQASKGGLEEAQSMKARSEAGLNFAENIDTGGGLL